jgi:Ca-activated chloride channel family protein
MYISFLMDRPQQEKALKSGFRPGLESVPLAAPVDKGHGVDPTQPKVELQPPTAEVIRAALKLWKANKKHCQVVLVMDTSGSMQIGGRMTNAKAKQLLGMLGDDDEVAVVAFSSQVRMIEKGVALKTGREALNRHVDAFFPAGETALYDAVDAAYRHLQANTKPGRATAVVVLTDGEDNKSRLTLEQLLARVKIDYEKRPIRVFCIAYGDEAREEVLRKISDATEAKAYKGSPQNIKAVFADIGTFF